MAYCIWKSYKLIVDPFEVVQAIASQRQVFFLDSSLNSPTLGRYSFLGIDPFFVLRGRNQDPFPALREALNRYKITLSKPGLPFLGGAVGYLSYDLGLLLEKKINASPKGGAGIDDYFFGFYNTVIIIDHLKLAFHIFMVGFPEKKYHFAKSLCERNFKKINQLISGIGNYREKAKKIAPRARAQDLTSNFTKEGYLCAIKKAKEYIRAGDIYQVNLSQQFRARTSLSGLEIYRRLRMISPAYFNAYLDTGQAEILSSSPERFLRLENNIVTTRPMKGTRMRGRNKIQDLGLKNELLKSDKDKAELVMIVDLERNDLGRVCSYDSVKVKALRQLEEYSTVFQATSDVCGRLHNGKDRIDLLRACFPGGSITGAPKIRAMEVIEELEPHRRSIYTGCLGYLSFCGNMDFNILIRTILKQRDRVSFGCGGGIVADSRPEAEYRETMVKARAMLEAIGAKKE